ncbi:hypothetical protein A1O7_04595 [Cladophialophora yegresii CBS 114405]|uniref:Uncharacterized protein n=1 Tax=Cladophialophora yegresii CBS 114405 TaxID=1182544 RepID=W9VXQ2_9EURO|nr:uncharacterized protein A1O7_04595 [Cladophialophora yegresii CBS 114405]EXJ60443.1 hypothetical protein A1O7_04595 [Cladophialophora yegresii CBS 114405]
MKLLSLAGAVAWCAFDLRRVTALSNITFYSDNACQKFQGWKTGPDDGTCTPFPTNVQGFLSYMVTSLDQTCAVTVYGSDVAFCSSTTLFIAPFSDCMTATNVSQFSVDCQDLAVATSAVPSVVANGAPNPTGSTADTDASSNNTGLSGGAKAGIAVAAAVAGLGLIALLVFLVIRGNRRKRADTEAKRALENKSQPPAPPYSELPQNEKKPAMEMHAAIPQEIASSVMTPVEAPGDERWGPRQELPGDWIPTPIEGSQVSPRPIDSKTVVSSEGTTVVGGQGNLDSEVGGVSQP